LFQIPRRPPPTLKDPSNWSQEFNDFIAKCLVKDFEVRPFMRQLLEHAFLKLVDGHEHQARRELKKEIGRHVTAGGAAVVKRDAEVTMKQGKLRTVKKQALADAASVQDLATLEVLTEVSIPVAHYTNL
jgi:myosin-3